MPQHFKLSDASKHLKRNVFTVPEDYFKTSRKKLLMQAKIMQQGEDVFQIPDNYPAALSERIMARVGTLSDEQSLPKSDGFSVPDDYFETLSDRIADQCKDTPVQALKKPFTWIQYAVAACLLVGISLFTWIRLNPSDTQETNTIVHINEVDTDDIIEYLAMYSEPGDMEYLSDQLDEDSQEMTDAFSSEDIEAYLEDEF